jgi:hypothetical protein
MGGDMAPPPEEVERLNLASRHEIEVLCAAFGCDPTDVYVAVATVGDKCRDVRRHLRGALGREEDCGATILRMTPLPTLWPTVS